MEHKRITPATPAEKIIHRVVDNWRPAEREALGNKDGERVKSLQFHLIRDLRKLADEAGKGK